VNALKLNFEMAIRNGATIDEIFEALFQVAVYAGFPAMWDALVKLEETLVELAPTKAEGSHAWMKS
jgi:4-carboxymuconolactone decarboxylase